MNRCANGGTLANARTLLPEDLSEYLAHEEFTEIGCNRLFCRDCESWVRSAPALSFAEPDMDVNLNALYELPDLASAPQIVESAPHHRLYICRCRRWLEAYTRKVYEPNPNPGTDPDMPWRCGGHPPFYLPGDVDGVRLDGEADVGPLAERALTGFVPEGARPKERVGGAWVARLYGRLRGTPPADVVARAAADRLADPDPAVRGRAIHFFFFFPLPVGVNRILDLLEGDRGLYAGVASPSFGKREHDTLEDALWWAVGSYIGSNERVTQLARKEVVTPGRGQALYHEMMERDRPWILEHADEIARANPQLVLLLLKNTWWFHDQPRAVLATIISANVVPPTVWAVFADEVRLDERDRAWIAKNTPKAEN